VSSSVGIMVWNKGRYFLQKRQVLQYEDNTKDMEWEYCFIYFSHFSLSCRVLLVQMCNHSGQGLKGYDVKRCLIPLSLMKNEVAGQQHMPDLLWIL